MPTNGNVVKALISNLPFNDFSWIIEADSGTGSPYTIASGDTIDFVGVGNVSTAWDNTTKELRISTSSDPGSGTQFTLPVWDTTTSLGDSMVKQDAATGTTLTISGLEPLVIIDDTTTDKGSLTISRAADATTYMSSGTSTSGSETFGTHIFSQTDGTTPRSVITLNADRTTTFSDNIVIDQGNSGISRIHTGSVDGSDSGGLTLSGAGGTSAGRAAYIVLSGNENTGDARMLTGNTANAKLYLIAGATSGSTIRMQTAGTDTLVLDHSKNATFSGSITTNLSSAGTYFTGGSGGTRQLSITSGTNISAHALHTFNIASSNGKYEFDVNGTTELSLNGSSAAFAGNVEIDGNLTVDGAIIHGGIWWWHCQGWYIY